jgi:hypothetical protein
LRPHPITIRVPSSSITFFLDTLHIHKPVCGGVNNRMNDMRMPCALAHSAYTQ